MASDGANLLVPKNPEAAAQVTRLGLTGHPEGGYFSRWYTSSDEVPTQQLSSRRGYPIDSKRPVATSIHYLLEGGRRSCLHRIRGDELWFWHGGGPLVVVELLPPHLSMLDSPVTVRTTVLGPDSSKGHVFTHTVPGGAYFGAYCPADTSAYALVSCVVVPGFDFTDWEMHTCSELPAVLLRAAEGHSDRDTESRRVGLSPDVLNVIGYLGQGGEAPLPSGAQVSPAILS